MKLRFRKIGDLSAIALFTLSTLFAAAQAAPSTAKQPIPSAQSKPAEQLESTPNPQKDTRMSKKEAKELFSSIDRILTFASDDTDLPIQHQVKRKLISREQVEKYVMDQLHDDKSAKRMQREEIVLKKFGLLDQNFHLQPFLVSLLTEQIAGFYDNKTKTVNLLDWVAPDEQKPVMAHELTHALQDQHTNLQKWEPDDPDTVSKNVAEDNKRLAIDERDTARDAVLEGQAMAVYVDYALQSSGKSLRTSPDVGDSDAIDTSDSSPVMARAPKLLQESLLFPYRSGLEFEQRLLKDKGPEYAFAGVLDHPPSSSYQIMNPRAYERWQSVPLLHMPDVHGLLHADYEPYDIGVMGELDVKILSEVFSGDAEAASLTPQWNGGLYYAVQAKTAITPEEKASTASIRLLYLSAWRSQGAANEFARMYGREIRRQYSKAKRDSSAESAPGEQVYETGEGPMFIVRQGKQVFVSESFDLDTARKLELLLLGAQQGNTDRIASNPELPAAGPAAPLIHFMAGCGMMKAALLH